MAIVRPIENLENYNEQLAASPLVIQEMAKEKPPDRLYRISSGHRVTISSYSEDRTVTVDVTGEFNRVAFSRRVFGIPFDELVECDLPGPDEKLGDESQELGLTQEEILARLTNSPVGQEVKNRRLLNQAKNPSSN